MEQHAGIDPTRQANSSSRAEAPHFDQTQSDFFNARLCATRDICQMLSVESTGFMPERAYDAITKYLRLYERWQYSEISAHLFHAQRAGMESFLPNLEALREHAYQQLQLCQDAGQDARKRQATAIDKLWDHANLALKQHQALRDDDKAFSERFEQNLNRFKPQLTQEMNQQFLSLIAIFTALSFIVFGGITALDSIFGNASRLPLLKLALVGCIWSLCISNLVFVFMLFISRLTRISIRATETAGAPLSRKYPTFVWCNFFLLLILAVLCWLSFLDYSGSAGWLVLLARRYSVISSLGGVILIGIVFGTAAFFLLRRPGKKKESPPDSMR